MVADRIMRDSFRVGAWPGLDHQALEHVAHCIETFLGENI
jgi:dTDP-4-amino-4,6-dideoxygalactose transaminase